MSENPFGQAMDDAEDEQPNTTSENQTSEDFDLDRYLSELGSGPKDSTIGFAVDEPTHRFYQELANADDVDVDVRESMRDHIEKLARRHPEVFERAMRKLEIDREY